MPFLLAWACAPTAETLAVRDEAPATVPSEPLDPPEAPQVPMALSRVEPWPDGQVRLWFRVEPRGRVETRVHTTRAESESRHLAQTYLETRRADGQWSGQPWQGSGTESETRVLGPQPHELWIVAQPPREAFRVRAPGGLVSEPVEVDLEALRAAGAFDDAVVEMDRQLQQSLRIHGLRSRLEGPTDVFAWELARRMSQIPALAGLSCETRAESYLRYEANFALGWLPIADGVFGLRVTVHCGDLEVWMSLLADPRPTTPPSEVPERLAQGSVETGPSKTTLEFGAHQPITFKVVVERSDGPPLTRRQTHSLVQAARKLVIAPLTGLLSGRGIRG